ncbi:MAG: transposase domain-containing protein [Burkholderia sp.]
MAPEASGLLQCYSLIGTCKLNGINPRAYLEYVLTHIADYLITRIDGLLPWNGADKLKSAAIPLSTI